MVNWLEEIQRDDDEDDDSQLLDWWVETAVTAFHRRDVVSHNKENVFGRRNMMTSKSRTR
jgi:hypothetical protein